VKLNENSLKLNDISLNFSMNFLRMNSVLFNEILNNCVCRELFDSTRLWRAGPLLVLGVYIREGFFLNFVEIDLA
jgi:hypothetical protein